MYLLSVNCLVSTTPRPVTTRSVLARRVVNMHACMTPRSTPGALDDDGQKPSIGRRWSSPTRSDVLPHSDASEASKQWRCMQCAGDVRIGEEKSATPVNLGRLAPVHATIQVEGKVTYCSSRDPMQQNDLPRNSSQDSRVSHAPCTGRPAI